MCSLFSLGIERSINQFTEAFSGLSEYLEDILFGCGAWSRFQKDTVRRDTTELIE